MRPFLVAAGLVVAALAVWLALGREEPSTGEGAPPGVDGAAASADVEPTLAGRGGAAVEVQAPSGDLAPRVPAVLAVGFVVDEMRRPVADAEVVATISDRETGRTRSAEDGRFEVPLRPPPPDALYGTLVIRKDDRGATRVVHVGAEVGDRLDYGRIPITGLHALTVRVVRAGAPAVGAEVVVGDGTMVRSRTALSFARSDAAGLARFERVQGPKIEVYAVAPGTGRGHREVRLPVEGVVDLELPDDRTATIHVRHGVTGSPVAGAEVSLAGGGTMPIPAGIGCLPPLPDLRTDAEGDVVASGLPHGHVWVVARAPGLAMRNQGMMLERVILQPEDAEATVTLWPYRAVRFPVSEGGAGAPPDGTALEVRRYQPLAGYDVGQPRARIEGGQLVLEPFPPGFDWGHVVAADGRWAKWNAPLEEDLGDPVEFRKIHGLRVRLTWPDGTPAAGEFLSLVVHPRGRRPPTPTDSDGQVVFARCVGESATVLWTSVATGFGSPLRSVNLATDPGPVTLTIDRPIDIALRIRTDCEPRIPQGLEILVPDLDPTRGGTTRQVQNELREDPASSEISFRWLRMPSGGAPPVTVRAEGIPEVNVAPQQGGDGVWRADVDLHAGGRLRVRVGGPADGRYWLQLERWVEASRSWTSLHGHPGAEAGRRAVDGVHTFSGLTPGRYRLVEGYTSLASDPVELVGGRDVETMFDVSTMVIVRGHVVVPEGEEPAYASFHAKDRVHGQVSVANPVRVRTDGTFEFRAVRGERLVLVAQHPLLLPDGEPEAFAVGADEPVLRFVTGPHVVFRIEGSDLTTPDPDPNSYPSWHSPVQVRVRKPGAREPDGRTSATIAKNGRFRAGVPGSGTWHLVIEQPGFVPILLGDVDLGPGATDLGTVRQSEGATLTVRLLPGDGGLPRDLAVHAQLQGDPSYTAGGSRVVAGDPPTVTVKGLGPGRFMVIVLQSFRDSTPLGEAFVDSDGTGPITVDVKLR